MPPHELHAGQSYETCGKGPAGGCSTNEISHTAFSEGSSSINSFVRNYCSRGNPDWGNERVEPISRPYFQRLEYKPLKNGHQNVGLLE